MSIRLLNKREIDKAKAKDQRLEIQEGLKLAKRVDALRETAVEEELSLKKFREATIKNIHEELSTEGQKLETLKVEVKALESRKEEALKPLTEAWDTLRREQEALSKAEEELANRFSEAFEVQESLKKEQKEIKTAKSLAESDRERALDASKQAERNRADTSRALDFAERVQRKALLQEEQVKSWAERQEEEIAVEKKNLQLRTTSLARKEKALEKREIRLKDRQEQLQRTIKRYGT